VAAARRRAAGGKAADLLASEVAELEAIASALFRRMDERLAALRAMEERLDARARALEDLVARAEQAARAAAGGMPARRGQVLALGRKGLCAAEIAAVLDMPRGEVDLILAVEAARGSKAG